MWKIKQLTRVIAYIVLSVTQREIIQSCIKMAPEKGYETAKNMLKSLEFGEDYLVSAAYMEKVLGWPIIKHEDLSSSRLCVMSMLQCYGRSEIRAKVGYPY